MKRNLLLTIFCILFAGCNLIFGQLVPAWNPLVTVTGFDCPGDTQTLAAAYYEEGSYTWLNVEGDTIPGDTSSIKVTEPNTYYAVMNHPEGEFTTFPTAVLFESVPTPTLEIDGNFLSSSESGEYYYWYKEGNLEKELDYDEYLSTTEGEYTVQTQINGCLSFFSDPVYHTPQSAQIKGVSDDFSDNDPTNWFGGPGYTVSEVVGQLQVVASNVTAFAPFGYIPPGGIDFSDSAFISFDVRSNVEISLVANMDDPQGHLTNGVPNLPSVTVPGDGHVHHVEMDMTGTFFSVWPEQRQFDSLNVSTVAFIITTSGSVSGTFFIDNFRLGDGSFDNNQVVLSTADITDNSLVINNPVSNVIKIDGSLAGKYEISTVHGEPIKLGNLTPSQGIDVQELEGGIYLLSIKSSDGEYLGQHKFLKE